MGYVAAEEELVFAPDRGESVSRVVADAEMVDKIQKLLSREEQFLIEQRANGKSWMELASAN